MTTELEPQVLVDANTGPAEDSTIIATKSKSDELSTSTATTLHLDTALTVESNEGVAVAAEMDNGGVEDDDDEEEDTEAEEMELEQAADDEEDDMAEIDPSAIIERRTRGVKLTYDAAPLPAEDEDDPEDEDVVMEVDDQ
ncbi:hypothetical protein BJ742DRAFT_855601 [Cladochytrium replicatum]|nr:hypothetical protein BJ742DRAFT_855601 [Cladochytrium replicatum]